MKRLLLVAALLALPVMAEARPAGPVPPEAQELRSLQMEIQQLRAKISADQSKMEAMRATMMSDREKMKNLQAHARELREHAKAARHEQAPERQGQPMGETMHEGAMGR